MGLIREALFAFRGRRFTEWLFMDRPQIPIALGISFYALLYLNYKYDLVARIKGQPTFDDYSYIKEAVERERARKAALSSSPSQSAAVVAPLSSTGVN